MDGSTIDYCTDAEALKKLKALNTKDGIERIKSDFMTNKKLGEARISMFLGVPQKRLTLSPVLYEPFRLLKFKAEGLAMTRAEVKVEYADLITALKKTGATEWEEVYLDNHTLYKEVIGTGYAAYIKQESGIGGSNRKGYIYMEDQELIEETADFESFTDLHHRNNSLHMHITGRGLLNAVVKAHPHYFVEHIGLGHRRYQSEAERVVGNWLVHTGCKHQYDVPTGLYRQGSSKEMRADFMFEHQGRNVYLELLQNTIPNRGKRRESYVKRLEQKVKIYGEHGLDCVFVDTDILNNKQGVMATELCEMVRNKVGDEGIKLPKVPKISVLKYNLSRENSTDKSILMNGTVTEVLALFDQLGITRVGDLQNLHSPIYKIVCRNSNYKAIHEQMKNNSRLAISKKNKLRHKKNRAQYAPVSVVKCIFKENNINSEGQWYEWALAKKTLRKELKIPSNLPSVYTQLGEWTRWADMWAKNN